MSLAGSEATYNLIEFPCRFGRRQSRKLFRKFPANLEMLIVHRIVPIAAPNEKALICKNADNSLDHSWPLPLPWSIV
jgi:hypothetical protein